MSATRARAGARSPSEDLKYLADAAISSSSREKQPWPSDSMWTWTSMAASESMRIRGMVHACRTGECHTLCPLPGTPRNTELCPGPRPVRGKSSAFPLPRDVACATLTGVTLDALPPDVKTGDLLWTPSAGRGEQAGVTAFARWLKDTRGLELSAYNDLWQWSVTDIDAFWQAIWDYN